MYEFVNKLEPAASTAEVAQGTTTAALVSLAISMKRVADVLDDIVRKGAAINIDIGNR